MDEVPFLRRDHFLLLMTVYQLFLDIIYSIEAL